MHDMCDANIVIVLPHLTYSEVTVAIAAPLMPKPKKNINIRSSSALSRLPAPEKGRAQIQV